ncbi:MAG: 50S ribosomal protein L21 [Chloroherpetonaceae bacterium]|nr:50S ribosomal protein L21 [Chthonomonadaceae bacterium]MDW8207299.1 50S ribosomal protein L21 [Chloroherpetonaceae bacterium]
MYAIVKTGGKQYRVEEGSTLVVEKIDGEVNSTVELTDVLAVGGDGTLKVGTPCVDGAKVIATILAQGRGVKIRGFTYKPKKNVRRRYGHRQWHTTLRIDQVVA